MEVVLGGKYKHFKGHIYEVLLIANDADSEDENIEEMVVYQNVETKDIWVRNLKSFVSEVPKDKYPNIHQQYRFELILE